MLRCVKRRLCRVSDMPVKHASSLMLSATGRGGTIYFGINQYGIVRGVNINRDERDEFRIGVVRIMADNIQPLLSDSQLDITYCPVVRQNDYDVTGKPKPINNLHVIGKESNTTKTLRHCRAHFRKQHIHAHKTKQTKTNKKTKTHTKQKQRN